MTRDEMIFLLAKELLKQTFEYSPSLDANGDWDEWKDAEKLLKVIEDTGLLPKWEVDPFESWRQG